jgi:hypothetical protein
LKLKCDILVSKFAFKWVNLCRYDGVRVKGDITGREGKEMFAGEAAFWAGSSLPFAVSYRDATSSTL